jgi:hypothetical protein
VTTVINPKSNFIIEEGQRAIVIPWGAYGY